MKNSRELDAEICKVIFGWTKCFKVPPDAEGKNSGMILAPSTDYPKEGLLPLKGEVGEAFFCPHYSSDFGNALILARHVGLTVPAKDLPKTAEEIAQLCLDFFRKIRS